MYLGDKKETAQEQNKTQSTFSCCFISSSGLSLHFLFYCLSFLGLILLF